MVPRLKQGTLHSCSGYNDFNTMAYQPSMTEMLSVRWKSAASEQLLIDHSFDNREASSEPSNPSPVSSPVNCSMHHSLTDDATTRAAN